MDSTGYYQNRDSPSRGSYSRNRNNYGNNEYGGNSYGNNQYNNHRCNNHYDDGQYSNNHYNNRGGRGGYNGPPRGSHNGGSPPHQEDHMKTPTGSPPTRKKEVSSSQDLR